VNCCRNGGKLILTQADIRVADTFLFVQGTTEDVVDFEEDLAIAVAYIVAMGGLQQV
jgi:hypothetical protein